MTTTNNKPEPGVYKGVPFADYLEWDAISNSRINLARRSLLHFKECVFTEPTESLRLGSFIHCGVLEPLAIVQRYAVMPEFEKDKENCKQNGERSTASTTEYVKKKREEFARVNAGKEMVTQAMYATLMGVSRAIAGNKRARTWLAESGDTELSLVWVDRETELLCKARLDFRAKSGTTDLKTSRDVQNFASSIAKYGYHRQLAHYANGCEALFGGEMGESRLIAVEPTPPYGIRSAPLNEDALETGRTEVEQALRAIAGAYESGVWPCYEDPSVWCLPAYYESDGEEITLTMGGQTVSF